MNVAKGKPSDYGADLLQRRFRLTTSLVNLEGKRILDFGCGNGAQTVTFTEMSAEITALDVHQPSLDQLSAYLRENEITDITPVQYDGSSIPFPDASFDAVISYEVLEHVQQESLALEEIARVLKAGGELIMSVPNKAWVFETVEIGKKIRKEKTKKAA